MSRKAESGRNRPKPAEARKAAALPLVAAGASYAEAAEAAGVSARTVRRWATSDPEFVAAIDARRSAAFDAIDSIDGKLMALAEKALAAISDLLGSDDERIRLEAAKTTMDRFGHPVMAKTEQSVEHKGEGKLLVMTEEQVRLAARMREGE